MGLTQEMLKELLHYNPETGIFRWKERDIKWFKKLVIVVGGIHASEDTLKEY